MTEFDLPKSPLFDLLNPTQRRELPGLMESQAYPAGATILAEGSRTGCLWVVARGMCEVVKNAEDGRTHVLAVLEAGGVFGEMAFYSTDSHAASVRCVTEVEVLKLTEARYAELERTAPAVAYGVARAIIAVLSDRLRRMDEWTGHLLGQSMPERREEWSEFRAKLYNNWDF